MSRNLCTTSCVFCRGDVALDEAPRPITSAEAGRYFDEYEGMLVAFATCSMCEAQYLAWVDGRGRTAHRVRGGWGWDYPTPGARGFGDLSHRSTFDDEPGEADMPRIDCSPTAARAYSLALERLIAAAPEWAGRVLGEP